MTEKLQAEIEEIELKIRREVRISMCIKADVLTAAEGQIVVADVEITNHGNQATTIKWTDEPPAFSVRSVEFDEDGKPRQGPPQEFRVMSTRIRPPRASHVIRAGTTETLTFAFRPARLGLYLLSFRGATAADVREEARKYGVALPTAWTAREYLLVGAA